MSSAGPDAGAGRPPRLRSDAQLVAGLRAGRPDAADEIARRYRPQLRAYCARLVGADDADDAVQETLIKALAALPAMRCPVNLRPWLLRVAHNASIDHLRGRPAATEPPDLQIDGVRQPQQIFATRAQLRGLLDEAATLPERQRAALRMRVVEGRSYDEIALALGTGEGSVRALLHRARSRLREVAAVALAPLRPGARHGALAHAGAGGAGTATTVKAALVVGALATGGAVAMHARAPADGAHARHAIGAAIRPAATATTTPPRAAPRVARRPLGHAGASAATPGPARARTAMRYAAKGHAAHGQGSATRRAAGPVTQPSPAGTQPVVADKRLPGAVTAPAGGAPATTPSAAPAAAATAPQATPAGSGPPPAAQPAETTTTDTQGSGGTGEPPAGEPAATPAPAAHGQISAWTPDPGGAEGLLAVRSGDNAPVARRVSRSTDLRCYRVSGDALVAFGSCPASALVTGRPVASAELQPADGGLTWRLVYLIVPA